MLGVRVILFALKQTDKQTTGYQDQEIDKHHLLSAAKITKFQKLLAVSYFENSNLSLNCSVDRTI